MYVMLIYVPNVSGRLPATVEPNDTIQHIIQFSISKGAEEAEYSNQH